MEKLFNFKIESTLPCSTLCIANGLNNFLSLCNHLKNLPYGRTNNRSDYNSVLKENKGTCSTKHAFLKQVAIENNIDSVKLFIGIYKMNNSNTKGIGKVLEKHNLQYIPEAHTYIKINNTIVDITRNTISGESFENTLLKEVEIIPNAIGDFKIQLHQNYLKQWILKEELNYNFESIWSIREQCITAISA
ncbi:hypothetical protein [Lacinutrix sp.]|uniref:hypothetical protein n=1 Tax=Lacinutrix sp. TaxID=1937692 RepID=UPI0025BEDA87|nr:hypothetical protein [Lacinutrix sp.]